MQDKIVDSVLEYLPPSGDRINYRINVGLAVQEGAQLESLVTNPTLPFDGNQSLAIRTILRYGIVQLHHEHDIEEDSFLQAMKPMLGHELMKWSWKVCDEFAFSAVEHLDTVQQTGDLLLANEVVTEVCGVVEAVKHRSAKIMLKKALSRRGFIGAMGKLRQAMIDNDMNIYYLDNLVAESFNEG